MRISFRYFGQYYLYLLLLFCLFFGLLYFVGVLRDLTANLFAALITVLVFDQIVKKWEKIEKLQKTKRSVNYVKQRIMRVYMYLIWRMRPPKDWQERLKKTNSNWDDYYGKVWYIKEDALNSLETIFDRYHYLIDSELQNDVLEMVGLLKEPTRWMMVDPSVAIERKPLDLYNIAGDVTNVIVQSINTIKDHKLLEDSESLRITSRHDEPPKMRREKLTNAAAQLQTKRHYTFFDQILKESIKFRDKCYKRVFK